MQVQVKKVTGRYLKTLSDTQNEPQNEPQKL